MYLPVILQFGLGEEQLVCTPCGVTWSTNLTVFGESTSKMTSHVWLVGVVSNGSTTGLLAGDLSFPPFGLSGWLR